MRGAYIVFDGVQKWVQTYMGWGGGPENSYIWSTFISAYCVLDTGGRKMV